jgi:addiction module RelB/DinJ family antitoxin
MYNVAMKDSVIRARVDQDLKEQARAVLASCGLEMSDALRLFLIQVVHHGGLPFPVRQVVRHTSEKKLKKMKRDSQARDRALAETARVVWPDADLANEPADGIAVEEFQTKRRPQTRATARDIKQKHAAHYARRQAAKLPKA